MPQFKAKLCRPGNGFNAGLQPVCMCFRGIRFQMLPDQFFLPGIATRGETR